jgi:predicted GNAT superfamily acetyltransferase
MDINSVAETKLQPNRSLGYYTLKKLKTRFDKGYSKLLHQRKADKFYWLQHTNKRNGDNLNKRGYEATRHF